MDLGEKIKYLRTSQGMTLEEVGDAVGVGKSTVRKWESGQIANMRRDKIALVAKALHVTPSYLMGWDEIAENLGSSSPSAKKLREIGSKNMSIGERIKARRKDLGMSAETLADMIGKSPATVYRYEKGDISGVDSRVLLPIADALGTTPGYLMGWDEIAENLGSDSSAAKKLQEIKRQFKSPMIDEMVQAMQRMTLKEQRKMVDVGKALFPERFKDDTKE